MHKGPPVKAKPPVTLDEAARSAGQVIADIEREDIAEAKAEQRPIPKQGLRVFERRHLWAWIHQATDEVLKELYATAMDKHGPAELGEMLRQYFTARAFYPNSSLNSDRCPFCSSHRTQPVEADPKPAVVPVKKRLPGRK